MYLFIYSNSIEDDSIGVGELKLLSEILLPGLIDDNLVGLDWDSEEKVEQRWASQLVGVVVSDIPAAHALDVLSGVQQKLVIGFNAISVRSPFVEARDEAQKHDSYENSCASRHVES